MIKKYLVPKNTLSLSLLGNSRLGILVSRILFKEF